MKAEIGKRYKHYKGYEYTVLAIACDEETLEAQVVYRADYTTEKFGLNAVWVRPLDKFEGQVEVAGKMIERFIVID